MYSNLQNMLATGNFATDPNGELIQQLIAAKMPAYGAFRTRVAQQLVSKGLTTASVNRLAGLIYPGSIKDYGLPFDENTGAFAGNRDRIIL